MEAIRVDTSPVIADPTRDYKRNNTFVLANKNNTTGHLQVMTAASLNAYPVPMGTPDFAISDVNLFTDPNVTFTLYPVTADVPPYGTLTYNVLVPEFEGTYVVHLDVAGWDGFSFGGIISHVGLSFAGRNYNMRTGSNMFLASDGFEAPQEFATIIYYNPANFDPVLLTGGLDFRVYMYGTIPGAINMVYEGFTARFTYLGARDGTSDPYYYARHNMV